MKTPYHDQVKRHPKSMVVISLVKNGIIISDAFKDIGYSYSILSKSKCFTLYCQNGLWNIMKIRYTEKEQHKYYHVTNNRYR